MTGEDLIKLKPQEVIKLYGKNLNISQRGKEFVGWIINGKEVWAATGLSKKELIESASNTLKFIIKL